MRLTEQVHLILKEVLRPGDTAIDATAGNGYDTLAMAELVGPSGKVIAVDLQSAAIEATRGRLKAAGQLAQVELIQGDHAEVLRERLIKHRTSVSAVTFNLGYLPGGEKQVTTEPETTLRALDVAQSLLKPGGILLVIAYRGHDGGMNESTQVASWIRALPATDWKVEAIEPATRQAYRIPPILWIARKLD